MKLLKCFAIAAVTVMVLVVLYVQFPDNALARWLNSADPAEQAAPTVPAADALTVHYIDIGQADATLLASGGEYMLIDAGEYKTADTLLAYLNKQNIQAFKYVVGTHPHSDHIGAISEVIKGYKCDNLILPNATHTTKSFEYMLDAAEEAGLEITVPAPGDTYQLGGTTLTILSPPDSETYDNLNNYSIVVRADCGETRFLFMGDAEAEIEDALVHSDFDLSSNVLKVGHHGSKSSSTQAFLSEVSPDYAIISCGKDNTYDHPNEKVMARLNQMGIASYLTHESGTILIHSDGKTVNLMETGEKIAEQP